MKKGQTLTGKVIRLDFPNRGIVETEAGYCVVKNTLPGQMITLTINKIRKSLPEGRLKSIDQKSPLEITSTCPHFGKCGGCIMQNLPYDEQLRIKEEQLRRLLDLENFTGIHPSPRQFGYRNKMEFSFGDEYKDGPLALGMHRRESFYDIVTVDECQLVDEDYRRILQYTREYFAGYSHYHRMKHLGFLRHLLIRKAARTEEILIALVTTSQENHDLTGWVKGLLELGLTGQVNGILHIINDSVADIVRADELKIIYGQDWFYEDILGLRFKITAFSFFQTNSLGAEVLYEIAREYIGDIKSLDINQHKPIIYDLYCGTGTITQLLAPIAEKVIGVDIVEEAIIAACENAKLNGLHNCEFIAGDVLKVLDDIKEKPDFIVLDPPRDGLHPKALKKILAYDIPRLLYISCKPTSLNRDLKEFAAYGYTVSRAAAVDLFPATGNVEVVCLLAK
ncbi:MAG: 23S rRNA (uracil(1939)-C(5))-methyltransferase RlmD [Lachnospiraceae bacterium]|nr:23S rRNA (uracil(1939)-C(5))-methyltransferase RlmD [Lachnospiraceae bacterium]